MGEVHQLTNSAIPITRQSAERMVHWLRDTERTCGLIASAFVERFDLDDGDADLEVDRIEDDFVPTPVFAQLNTGPGCEISDPDEGVDDQGEAIDEREPDPGEYDSGEPIPGGGSGI